MKSIRGGVYLVERVILTKIESIERCVQRIDEIYGGDIERLNDYLYQDAIVLNIQRACQQSIDLSMYLCSKLAFGIPKSSRDSFTLLKENKVITEDISKLMEKMVGSRNVVIHEYQEVELEIIKFIVEKGREDFLKYTNEILNYIKKMEDNR